MSKRPRPRNMPVMDTPSENDAPVDVTAVLVVATWELLNSILRADRTGASVHPELEGVDMSPA